jgi:hypothetical protein
MEATGTYETLVTSYHMLRCIYYWSVTDVEGQFSGPVCNAQILHSSSLNEDGTGKQSRNVGA